MTIPRRTLAGLLAAATLAHKASAQAQVQTAAPTGPAAATPGAAALEQVAQFDQQVTGVAVSKTGRVFVNFPRWEQDVPLSVAEVMKDGSLRPYPNAEWNAWRNEAKLSNADHFVCVQSVTIDPQGYLWVVDPAAPGNEFNLDGGPKILKIDLNGDKVVKVIRFDRTAVPQGSYLNDIRVSPDGRTGYMTDSGVKGALIVVDLGTGKAQRVLDGHPSTQVDPSVKVQTDGKPLKRPDNRGPMFAADGIALDPKGEYLYWQALTGNTLYRIATKALQTPAKAAAAIEKLGTTCVADGYWMDAKGRLFITSPEDNSVKRREPDGKLHIVAQDDRLRWPDSMAEGADGTLYVTASHIQDMAQFTTAPRKGQTQLFRFKPA